MEIMNSKGFNFHMMELNNWVLDDGSKNIFDGSFASVLLYASRLGFDIEELEFGVETLLSKNHDSMHFGTFKSFIYSFNRKDKKKAA